MFKSLASKLLILILGIVLASNLILGIISYSNAKGALTYSVEQTLEAVADKAAVQIFQENDKEFQLLRSLAALPLIKDEDVPLSQKAEQIIAIADMDISKYENIGFYDANGDSIMHDGTSQNFAHASYVQAAMAGKEFVSDPKWNDQTSQMLMFYSVPVRNDSGKIIGVMSSIVRGDRLSQISQDVTIGKDSHPGIVNRETGNTIGRAGEEEALKEGQNSEDDFIKGTELGEVIEDLMKGNTGTRNFLDPFTNMKMTTAYKPIPGTTWSVMCAAPYEDYYAPLNTMTFRIVTTIVVTVILAVVICLFVITVSLKPLTVVRNAITEIASGNADLTRRIEVTSKDEIGGTVEGFNTFTTKLQTIVRGIKGSKTELEEAGEDLAASTEDTASSITQIIANIDSVHHQISNQSNSVTETAGAVNEIASNIESLENMIENQSRSVSQASSAVEEMIGNIASVNQSVEKMAASFEELQKQAQAGSSKQQDVNERIEQIEAQSEMLQEANQAIAAIAEQTNLLAMNAAIEAAHAGDAGKGFSVVADEIRKLSETSTQQSKTIGDQLNSIKESIGTVVSASAESSAAFMTVSRRIQDTDQLVRQIKAAMDEQNTGSRQITDALHVMNDSTSEVRTASTEMAEGNKQILHEVQQLQDATTVMKQSMEEMSIGAKKINETGAALSGIAEKMKTSILEIGDQIDQFQA